jgi:hypothetical protein
MASLIRIRLGNGRILTLDRAEATALVDELDATDDLAGAVSLSAQLTAALRASSLLLGGPIDLLAREEYALGHLLAILDHEPVSY